MKEAGIPFRLVETEHTDEEYPKDLSGGDIARYLAEHKSDSYTRRLEDKQVLLTADTIVWHRDKELGKPANREEAVEMLMDLSGETHQVFTGVCFRSNQARSSFFAVTDVTFSGSIAKRSSIMWTSTNLWIRQEPTVYRSGLAILP